MRTFWQQVGILRSILLYYRIPLRERRLFRFYAQFIQANDLCFDIGAHAGNRLRARSNLAARVVGIEPQPHSMPLLRRWYGRHPNITLVEGAVGSAVGIRTLFMSCCTPAVTTLDTLIGQYGELMFCKIDAEGYELEVLRGLSKPIPALSFEYNPVTIDIALDCIECLGQMVTYEFNWSPGESHRLESPVWLSPDKMVTLLKSIPMNGHYGDVHARHTSC